MCNLQGSEQTTETVLAEDLKDLDSSFFPVAIFVKSFLLSGLSFFFCKMVNINEMVGQVLSSLKIL